MKSILEELWSGNLCPCHEYRKTSEEEKELMENASDHYEALWATLTEAQKELLEQLDDCYAELTDMRERKIFVYAFRLGAKIALEVMSFGGERED